MPELWCLLLLIGGLVVLGIGGECLVRGASHLARSLGVSALVVGLTIVAFGTSAPEAAVSVQAVLRDQDPIAVGNVVGSNIANILLILGVAASLRPFKISLNLLKTDAPIMVMVAAIFLLSSMARTGSGRIERWEGMALFAGLLVYSFFTYRMARREPPEVADEYQAALGLAGSRLFNSLLVGLGIIALVIGGRLIVDGAQGLAEELGISKTIVGLTIVAIGTSLPELATSIIAIRHNQPDIAIGNIVGSNICNILLVIGMAATVTPIEIGRDTMFQDGPVMLVACLLFLAIAWSGQRVSRWEGLGLLGLYAVYLGWTAYRAM